MNKLIKILTAIGGAVDVVMYLVTPLLLAILLDKVLILDQWRANYFFILAFISSVFRAYKIGWLKNND